MHHLLAKHCRVSMDLKAITLALITDPSDQLFSVSHDAVSDLHSDHHFFCLMITRVQLQAIW